VCNVNDNPIYNVSIFLNRKARCPWNIDPFVNMKFIFRISITMDNSDFDPYIFGFQTAVEIVMPQETVILEEII
jgi:hypothetical protein